MSYKVLARKYRPAQFADLVGQEVVGRTLANAVTRAQVHHAYLFCGPRGVGKTSAARILAKALNCEKGPTPTPCGACPACDEIAAGHSMDVQEIDGASHNGVDHVRALQETARIRPARRCRVFIIDEVHMLSNQAFNALLKLLEEPPERVHFIFATTEPHKVIETIRSRCQRHDFRRIPSRQIVEALTTICGTESITITADALRVVAGAADGGMRDALSLLEQALAYVEDEISAELVAECLGVVDRSKVLQLLDQIHEGDKASALLAIDEIHQRGGDLARFADAVVEELRNLTLAKEVEAAADLLQLDDDAFERLQGLAQSLDSELLRRWFRIALTSADEVARSGHPRSLLEVMVLRMAASRHAKPIEDLLAALTAQPQAAAMAASSNPAQKIRAAKPAVAPQRPEVQAAPRAAPEKSGSPGIDQRIRRFLESVQQSSPPLAATLSLAGLHIEADEIRGRVSDELQKILRQETSRRDLSRALSQFKLRGLRIGGLFIEPTATTGTDLFDRAPEETVPAPEEPTVPAGAHERPPSKEPEPVAAMDSDGAEPTAAAEPEPTAPEEPERPAIGLFSSAPEAASSAPGERSVDSSDHNALVEAWLDLLPQLPEGLSGLLVSFAPMTLDDGELSLVSETTGLVEQVQGRLPDNLQGPIRKISVRVARPEEVELARQLLGDLRRANDPIFRQQMELREHSTTQAILDLFGARLEDGP